MHMHSHMHKASGAHKHRPAWIELETVQRGSYGAKLGRDMDHRSGGNAARADLRGRFHR